MRGGQNLFQVLVAIRDAHLERSPGIMLAQGKNALASGRTGSDLSAEAGPPGVNMEKQGRWAAEAEELVLKPCFRKFRIQQEPKAAALFSGTPHQLVFRVTWAHTGELKGKFARSSSVDWHEQRVRHQKRPPVPSDRALLERSRTCRTRAVQPSSQSVDCRQGWQSGKLTTLLRVLAHGQRRHNFWRTSAAQCLELALPKASKGYLLHALLRARGSNSRGGKSGSTIPSAYDAARVFERALPQDCTSLCYRACMGWSGISQQIPSDAWKVNGTSLDTLLPIRLALQSWVPFRWVAAEEDSSTARRLLCWICQSEG